MQLCTISKDGLQVPGGLDFSTFIPSYLCKACNNYQRTSM